MTPTNPIPEGMKSYSPEHPDYPNAPSDWSDGAWLRRDGRTMQYLRPLRWWWAQTGPHAMMDNDADPVAYTPKPTPPVGNSAAICHLCGVPAGRHEHDCPKSTLYDGDRAAERARGALRKATSDHPLHHWTETDVVGIMLTFASQEAAHVGEHLAVAKGGGTAADWLASFAEPGDTLYIDRAAGFSVPAFVLKAVNAALAERPAMPMPERGLFQAAANIVYRIEAAGRLSYEADNFERWKADARDLAPRLRLALLSQDRGEGVEDVVMLPREPTEAMMDAGLYHSSHDSTWGDVHTIWKAMFDAVALDGGVSTQLPADPATLPSPASGEGEVIREAPEARDRKVGECPDADLDPDKPCPRCQALSNEGCRLTILADAAFVHAARAALDSQQEKG